MSSGCSPKSFIIEDEILPGLASDIKVIALFNPMLNNSSILSNLADLLSHFKYGPNRPTLIVMSLSKSGCLPIILGSEHKYFALSRSTFSISKPFGIDTFLKLLSSFFFFLLLVFGFLIFSISSSLS